MFDIVGHQIHHRKSVYMGHKVDNAHFIRMAVKSFIKRFCLSLITFQETSGIVHKAFVIFCQTVIRLMNTGAG